MFDVHSLIRDLGMGPFPVLAFLSSQLLGLSLRFLLFKLLTFLEGDDIFPIHIILDIAHVSKLREEPLATEGSAFVRVGHRFVMFGVIEDVVQIHLVQLLVLIVVILVETIRDKKNPKSPRGGGGVGGGRDRVKVYEREAGGEGKKKHKPTNANPGCQQNRNRYGNNNNNEGMKCGV